MDNGDHTFRLLEGGNVLQRLPYYLCRINRSYYALSPLSLIPGDNDMVIAAIDEMHLTGDA